MGGEGASTPLDLAAAQRICDAAVRIAERGGHHISVAVADPAGELRAFVRMDGAAALSAETVRRKCRTVALTGRASGEFGRQLAVDLAREPELFHAMLGLGMFPVGGGIPVKVDGQVVGIVAVSGASSDDDQAIAAEAAKEEV